MRPHQAAQPRKALAHICGPAIEEIPLSRRKTKHAIDVG